MKRILLQGRLGNQLFILAFAKFMQVQWGWKVIIVLDDLSKVHPFVVDLARHHLVDIKIKKSFFVPKLFTVLNVLASKLPILGHIAATLFGYYNENQCQSIHKETFYRKKLISGFFQRAWIVCSIQKDFKEALWDLSDSYAQNLLNLENAVGIHLRRGDYRNNSSILGPGCLSWEYYVQALKTEEKFVCFTDANFAEIPPEMLKNASCVYTAESMDDISTMLNLARCKRLIIANSTLSWWSGFLAEDQQKEVMAPNPWFRSSPQSHQEIYLDGFIKLKSYFDAE